MKAIKKANSRNAYKQKHTKSEIAGKAEEQKKNKIIENQRNRNIEEQINTKKIRRAKKQNR